MSSVASLFLSEAFLLRMGITQAWGLFFSVDKI